MVNRKKANELAREIVRCESIIENPESELLDKRKAESKIMLISKAYSQNVEMLVAIAGEAEKLMKNNS